MSIISSIIPCNQRGSSCQDPAANRTTRRPADHRKETQTVVVWTCLPFFDIAYPLPTAASLTLSAVFEDDFGETVVARDMPAPLEFPSIDSCQKRFLWTHKEVDLAPHQLVSLVLQVFLRRLVSKACIVFSESA